MLKCWFDIRDQHLGHSDDDAQLLLQGDVGQVVHVHTYSLYHRVPVGKLTLQSDQMKEQGDAYTIFFLLIRLLG